MIVPIVWTFFEATGTIGTIWTIIWKPSLTVFKLFCHCYSSWSFKRRLRWSWWGPLTIRLHCAWLENDPIEFVQTKFIRWLLGVNKFCSSNACRSEVGRFPMRTKTKCRAIKYWLKFCEPEHQNKLSGIAFTDQIGQDKKELWPSKLKRLQVLNLGADLCDIWSAKTNTPATMSYIRQRLLDIEQRTWNTQWWTKGPASKKKTKNF